jgi:hypothetical protein
MQLQNTQDQDMIKCDPATGMCGNEALQISLELEKKVDLVAISKIAKPYDLQYWLL